jgi:hypothetical protein
VFYVWEPNVEKVWPAPQQQAENDDVTAPAPARRKPGRKAEQNWPLHVAGELYRIVIKEGKQPPPASYFAQFCENKLGYQPDIRALQRLLRLFV